MTLLSQFPTLLRTPRARPLSLNSRTIGEDGHEVLLQQAFLHSLRGSWILRLGDHADEILKTFTCYTLEAV